MIDPNQTGTIVVSGTGRVAVDPDIAELRLGVAVTARASQSRSGRPPR